MKQISALSNRLVSSTPRSHRVLAILPDNPAGLAVVRCLGQRGLAVFIACHPPWGGRKPILGHSRYCSGSWTLDVGPTSPELIEEVRALAVQLDVGSIMPMMEPHVCTLVRHRECFPEDVHLFIPPAESFEKAADKDYMHRLCMQLSVPIARGTTLDKLMSSDNESSLAFPLSLRVRNKHLTGQSYRPPWKVAYVRGEQELRELYNGYKEIASNIIVQEYHPGVEYFLQVLMQGGERVAEGGYMGEHAVPLAGGVTVRRVTFMHEQMRRDSIRILQAINWDGVAGVQFHYNLGTDRYVFLEVNPRFLLNVATVIKAGFWAPYLLWQSHFEPERMLVPQYREGLRMRSLGGDMRWMFAMLRGEQLPPDQRRLSKISAISQFLWHFGPWTKGELFLLRDLKPCWIQWESRILLFIRRLFARAGRSSGVSVSG